MSLWCRVGRFKNKRSEECRSRWYARSSGLSSERRWQRAGDSGESEGTPWFRILTRSIGFDANTPSQDISTPRFLCCTAPPHEWTEGMRRLVCANSHIALVRVDPVEQSLRSHPFHGQTTLQQQRRNRTAWVSRTILYRPDTKTWTGNRVYITGKFLILSQSLGTHTRSMTLMKCFSYVLCVFSNQL